jgi:hypothetical protein
MKWIDIHNLALGLVFFVGSLALAPQGHFRLWGAVISAIVTFLCLGGRVLTHGIDLARNGPGWKPYVVANTSAAGVNFVIWMLFSR